MSTACKLCRRPFALMTLTLAFLVFASLTPGSPLAADRGGDRDGGGGRKCRGGSTHAIDGFQQPEVRQSRHGVLQTTLHACISTQEMLDENAQPPTTVEFHPPTFEGTIPGPTLEVKPGDRLSILMVNDLPYNRPNERDNHFPYDENSLNFHSHGLTVSPLRLSDNIFREMRPGTTNLVQIDIPKDHPSGTYWYHVHKHGSVTYQFNGGMAGFLIVKGGEGSFDTVPEVAAAKDVPMAFQVVRSLSDGSVVFVHEQAEQFGTFPFPDMGPTPAQQGLWSTYGVDGGPTVAPDGTFTGPPSRFSYTTNGIANPTLHMRPGEVQRWRLLNATDGDNLQMVLVSKDKGKEGLGLNVVAMDAITVPKTYHLNPGDPMDPSSILVIGPGQRYDVMIKAGQPGTYLLQTLDPNSGKVKASVSPYRDAQFPNGIDPQTRVSRFSADFPTPCPPLGAAASDCEPGGPRAGQFAYPVTLATIEVSGRAKEMDLPPDPLPAPKGLPSIKTMLDDTKLYTRRNVIFENCGGVPAFQQNVSLPSCKRYFAEYDAAYWGGAPFVSLLMMRDADDVDFKKEGLFDPTQPLFPDMIAGNYEEWTVYNHTFSDHPFHIHQNHVLVTKINGIPLRSKDGVPRPEWHDTLDVPAVVCPENGNPPATCQNPVVINGLQPGSITFRTYFNPVTIGCFVAHCHTLDHEDLGMMQRMDILPAPGQPSGCNLDQASAGPLIEKFIASRSSFPICSAPRQLRTISYGPIPPPT